MCKKSRNLHGTKATKKQAKKAVKKQAVKTTSKKASKIVDEYDYEQEAYAFFLANEDVLYQEYNMNLFKQFLLLMALITLMSSIFGMGEGKPYRESINASYKTQGKQKTK